MKNRELCTRCKKKPRTAPGQRWCKFCRADYMRNVYRPRRAARLEAAKKMEGKQ